MQRYKTEYDAQAGEFMRKWGVKIRRHFIGKTRYFPDDREPRNVWKITLERNDGSSYSFRFGDSLVNTAKVPLHKPSDYSILACTSADSCFDCKDVWDTPANIAARKSCGKSLTKSAARFGVAKSAANLSARSARLTASACRLIWI